ncbi:MAG: hypothetical protein RLZZ444_2638 [Pseudomonadota bacterium]|jgi:hippurate hydrolase
MPVLNRISAMQDEIAAWRRELHKMPELMFDVVKTAGFVEAKLREFGCDEVVKGLGRTGVVGIIRGNQGNGPVVGLRADMDALPITEESGVEWASKTRGKMHACGHDGHTAMLLGAARYLTETRNFKGAVAVIFQPAEEGGGGGKVMVDDGLMTRFGIAEVYGMHNMPGLPVGQFATRNGPIMAATDEFSIIIRGRGGHAAMPHKTTDPVVVAAHVITSLQSIASRQADPLQSVVVSVTMLTAGHASNVIPDEVKLGGTIRTLTPDLRDFAKARLRDIAKGIAAAHGAEASVTIRSGYPVTLNHASQTEAALEVAAEIAGPANVEASTDPTMGGEDFSYMLEARPGNFIFVGNGDTAGLHNPRYDFNDATIPFGVSYWVRLAESRLSALS